jgi:hypothetical protein
MLKTFKEAMEDPAVTAIAPQTSVETWRAERPYPSLS